MRKNTPYDKVLVAGIMGAHGRKLTHGFLQLKSHYLFDTHFCGVRRANEKGVVEGMVGYARRNFLVPVPQVRELLRGEYLDKRENVLLIGNSGTGKTHLATALAFTACQQGRRARFFTVTGLVTQLLERREQKELERFHRQLERLDLLVLDELGYVPCSKAGAELLSEVVSRTYERTSLIVTTNLPFESWTETMGSERLTGALLDRLTHRIHILEANGESYRLRESKQRLKKQTPKQP